jgi:hypothetical protein
LPDGGSIRSTSSLSSSPAPTKRTGNTTLSYSGSEPSPWPATSRAEAQVVRLAAIYAIMDQKPAIHRAHLEAALALWRYAEASALYIFGDATGDRVADRIAASLEEVPDGLTRTDLINLFKRNVSRDRIDQALGLLERLGRVRKVSVETGGRPAEKWLLT